MFSYNILVLLATSRKQEHCKTKILINDINLQATAATATSNYPCHEVVDFLFLLDSISTAILALHLIWINLYATNEYKPLHQLNTFRKTIIIS
jgi:hypothetical protein